MAINLWKLSGGKTSFNPLPSGTNNRINDVLAGNYILKFKAYSLSSGEFTLDVSGSSSTIKNTKTGLQGVIKTALNPTPTIYEIDFSLSVGHSFIYLGANGFNDIIIEDIQLVEKPLPKLTINGITNLVEDWEQGSLTSSGIGSINETNIRLKNKQPINPNTEYILTYNKSFVGVIVMHFWDANGAYISYSGMSDGVKFTTPSNARQFNIRFQKVGGIDLLVPGEIGNAKLMLNLGPIPAPYEPKKGDRMVMPVAKKNLFSGQFDIGYFSSAAETLGNDSNTRTTKWMICKSNTNYVKNGGNRTRWQFKNANGVITFFDNGNESIKTPSDAVMMRCYYSSSGDVSNFQIEEGTTATPYEPYAVHVNEKPKMAIAQAKKGLVMDGVTNYLQLPSMTMDAIEIDCLIDVNQGVNHYLMDARTGLPNGFIYYNGVGVGISDVLVDGIIQDANQKLYLISSNKGKRKKFLIKTSAPFTDDVTIFARYIFTEYLKGILYGVKCYLNGQIVAEYDFTNPNNIVGDKVLQKAKNLIPSFEDSRWSLHANFKVLGKDVGRLDATSGTIDNYIELNLKQNTQYKYVKDGTPNGLLWVKHYDTKGNIISEHGSFSVVNITVPTNTFKTRLILGNGGATGSFDFIRPQLYELDGKEGTLYGNPVSELKAAKRVLYSKR